MKNEKKEKGAVLTEKIYVKQNKRNKMEKENI